MPKKALSATFGAYKITKNQNINWKMAICSSKYIKRPLLQGIGSFRSKLLEFINFSLKILFCFFCRFSEKNAVFWPKIGEKTAKFFKILEFDRNPINASYVQFLGHLDHFWPKNGHFWPFLAPFWPI